MIEGIIINELKQFVDDRGRVMHMIRADDPLSKKFGEVYFSEILPGVVKAWRNHNLMTQLFAVPIGTIRLVIYDDRQNSKSKGNLKVLEIGRKNYKLVKVPPKLWYGFKCISDFPALIVNCPDLPHDPDESEGRPQNDNTIPYRW